MPAAEMTMVVLSGDSLRQMRPLPLTRMKLPVLRSGLAKEVRYFGSTAIPGKNR